MEAVLFRTGSGSVPVQTSFVSGSSRVSFSIHDLIGGIFSGCRSNCSSPRMSLHLEPNHRGIRRVSSESDVIRSAIELSGGDKTLSKLGSRSFPARIPEEDFAAESDTASSVLGSIGSLTLTEDRSCSAGRCPGSGIPVEEPGFPGGGIGKNCNTGGNGGGSGNGDEYAAGGSADRRNLGTYYEEMLKSNPTDSLLLRNYGKYLHEVEGDMEKAEEYYGRAILASPGDGEVLSLYGQLIWETQRDESRAKCYFDQAVHASPDDCTVLGSYAHFMWEAEEDEEEEEEEEEKTERQFAGAVAGAAAMVAAY